jgi:hypothetical protein
MAHPSHVVNAGKVTLSTPSATKGVASLRRDIKGEALG